MPSPNSVYDQDADERPQQHGLPEVDRPEHETQPTGNPTDPRRHDAAAGDPSDPRGDLREAEEQGDGGGLFNKDGDSEGSGSGELAEAEAGAGGDLFNATDSGRGGWRQRFKAAGKFRKYMLVGAAGTGGIASVIIALVFMIFPGLKVENLVENLQSRFFATSEHAAENQTEKMLSRYIKDNIRQALAQPGCRGTTLDKKCNVHLGEPGTNPVKKLYKGWADARLENKLATNYGIEFKAKKFGAVTKYYMKAPGVGNPNGDDISSFVGSNDEKDLFREVSRGEARQAVRSAMQNETLWKKAMYRFKVGRLLEEKYGITRCIVFCGTRDAIGNKVADKKRAAQLYLVQRVVTPRTETLGIAMECLLNTGCDPYHTEPTTPASGSQELEGTPENKDTEGKMRDKLVQLAGDRVAAENIDKLLKDYQTIADKGYQAYLIKKVMYRLGMDELSNSVVSAVPVVGWVTRAAHYLTIADTAGPKVKKLAYLTNSAAAVSLFMTYRTYADEIHTSHVDPTEVGSMVSSLGQGVPDKNGDPVGGIAGAEESPLYNNIMSGAGQDTSLGLLNGLVPATAFAAGSTSSARLKCNDNKPLPAGKLLCPEEALGGQGLGKLDKMHAVLNVPGVNIITSIAGFVDSAVGKVINFATAPVGWLLSIVPGISSLTSLVSGVLQPFFNALINAVIPNPIGSNMGGARTADMVAAGAAVSGKDACAQIGCASVPASVASAIVNQQLAQNRAQFDRQPLFSRLASTATPYSLISRVASTTTFSGTAAQSNFAAVISNPLGTLTHSFGSLFSAPSVSAATSGDTIDPFRIGTTAFPDDQIPADAAKYWDAHNCGDTSDNGPIAQWQKEAADTQDPATGMPVHKRTEPCLLIKNAVGEAGGKYDTSLLSQDEQDILQKGGSSSSLGGSLPTGDAKGLANQLLPFIANGKLKCLASGCPDITRTAQGQSIKGGQGCLVDALDPAALGMLLKLAQGGHTFTLSALCSDHHNDGMNEHAGGHAVDFNTIDGVFMGPEAGGQWDNSKLGAAKKLDQDIASFMPKSTEFGQIQCHPSFDFLAGFKTYNDTCHHQHVRASAA